MATDRPRIDPELSSQLEEAGEDQRVEAVLALRPRQGAAEPPPPDEVEELVEDVLSRVAKQTSSERYEFNVFGFLDSFAISAEPRFLERLLSQPEIDSATANRPSKQEGS